MKIIGIDEVRKCPVIGSIYVCGFVCEEEEQGYLYNEIGVRDSKKIQYKIRRLANLLKERYQFKVFKIGADEISESDNINVLEAKYVEKILNWAKRVDVKKAFIDCFSIKLESYLESVKGIELVIETGADEKYACVMAASIIAKDYSDRELERLRKKYEFGSGDCSDPKTIIFLCENIDKNLKFVRKNWITYKRLKEDMKLREEILKSRPNNVVELSRIYKNHIQK